MMRVLIGVCVLVILGAGAGHNPGDTRLRDARAEHAETFAPPGGTTSIGASDPATLQDRHGENMGH